jgi:hypothetical protein
VNPVPPKYAYFNESFLEQKKLFEIGTDCDKDERKKEQWTTRVTIGNRLCLEFRGNQMQNLSAENKTSPRVQSIVDIFEELT